MADLEPDGPPRPASGEPPRRLRLTASASRRAAPSRATPPRAGLVPAPPPVPAPLPLVAPPVEPLPPAPRSRRAVLVVGAAGVLVVLVGVALMLRPAGPSGADVELVTRAQPQASLAGAYDAPLDLSTDTEYVETKVLDDDLVVTHWISTSTPIDRFRLRAPRSPVLADVLLDLEDLAIVADGVALDVDDVRLDVPEVLPSARQLYVSYRLAGAVRRNSSVRDRALATVTALGVGLEGRTLPRTQSFPGGRVMTLACLAQGARAVPESCGTYVEGAWQLTSAAGEVPVSVVAQFDLTVVH